MLKTRYHKLRLRLSLWRCRIWNWLKINFGSFRLTKRGLIGIYLLVVLLIGAFFVSRFQTQLPPLAQSPDGDEEMVATGPDEVSERPKEFEYRQEPPGPPGTESEANQDLEPGAQEADGEPEEEPTEPVVASLVQLENLQWPLANASIQCGYTLSAKSATLGDWRPHLAVDFAADKGAEVQAAAAGTVSGLVTNDPYWGTQISINHGGGWVSSYSNIANTTVKVGDRVAAGQVIGQIDENPPMEMMDSLHLHFVLLHNGQPVDPSDRWQR